MVKTARFIAGVSLAILASSISVARVEAAGDKSAKPAPDPNQVVCRRENSSVGSILPKRVCHTRAEWAALEDQGKRDIEQVRAMERSRSMVPVNH